MISFSQKDFPVPESLVCHVRQEETFRISLPTVYYEGSISDLGSVSVRCGIMTSVFILYGVLFKT